MSFKNKAWKQACSISSAYFYMNIQYLNGSNKYFRTHLRLIMPTQSTSEDCWKNQMSLTGEDWVLPGDRRGIQTLTKSLEEDQPGRS